MTSSVLHRATRKALVVGASATVIGAGVVSVEYAANWRAASAPLDLSPVSASSIGSSLDAEHQRTTTLSGEIDQVALQMADLRSALDAANGALTQQNGAASQVQSQLGAAQTKLATIQGQLKAAQQRLAQLNAAAAKQAALNAAAQKTVIVKRVTTTTGASGSGSGGHNDD